MFYEHTSPQYFPTGNLKVKNFEHYNMWCSPFIEPTFEWQGWGEDNCGGTVCQEE